MVEHSPSVDASISVALALAAGMVSQALARHLKIPGIVVLLAVGVLLGPDLAGVVRPESLGEALHVLVGFAVAVILFEGGMNLRFSRLKHQAKPIQRLITVGSAVTAVGGALVSRMVMGWDWRVAVAFGTLVVVTGPTVINPLLRRIKVQHNVETVLEAEGVLIDAVGAVLAVVTLEVILSATEASVAEAALGLASRLGFGALFGAVGGGIIALAVRYRHVIPEGLENVFVLSLVLALFQVSNLLLEESGIMTVTAAGLVVGNSRTHVRRELMEFKEQLTVMLIGMLFVLLAADVRLTEVWSLGWPGVVTVACLMLVVRPINVAVSTVGSELTLRERLFLSWLAPRGVVAAAVASLVSQSLVAAGVPRGGELRALVFTVIAATVLIQGISGGPVARLLGLRRSIHHGYTILGANELGRALGRSLQDDKHDVVFIENNPAASRAAEEEGFRVVFGSVLDERTLLRAQIDDRDCCLTVTSNEELNMLFAKRVAEEFKVPEIYVALRHDHSTVSPATVERARMQVLFGLPHDLDLWMVRFRRKIADIERWRFERRREPGENKGGTPSCFDLPEVHVLPLVLERSGRKYPVGSGREFRRKDVVYFATLTEQKQVAHALLRQMGWVPAGPERPESAAAAAATAPTN